LGNQKGNAVDLPYLLRAVELDPNFALAYRGLAVDYRNLGQSTRAAEYARKAFDLRQRVSERERYGIEAFYYSFVTGNLEKANQVYEVWKQSYPRDYLPFGNLADDYMRMGQWEKALKESLDSTALEPNSSPFINNLAQTMLALNRTEDASKTVEQARARDVDSYLLRIDLYQAAFLRGNQETMQQQMDWAAGRSQEEGWLLSTQSDTEAYFGHLAKAREFSERAVASARRADAPEAAALWQADAALHEVEVGNLKAARQNALAALDLMAGKDVSCLAALALARAGDVTRAKKIASRLNNEFRDDTLVQGYWLPAIRAASDINEKKAANAIESLKPAAAYELGQAGPLQLGMLYPIYLRGEAYLESGQGKEAAGEFERTLDHRGIVLNFPLGALARLGLARSYALQGDAPKARAAYKEFLTLWKDADPDVPILQQASAEYAKLK
jgi:predicted Zn-dependent protease